MPTNPQYAVLAANAYAESSNVVNPANVIPPPTGWSILDGRNLTSTGFLARAYRSETTNEVVIAYGGTTFEDGMKSLDWTKGNIPGATGTSLAAQIVDAAKFYLDVRKSITNPDGSLSGTISFTGHSLGGGLASLMAVYFDRDAWTFDQAPFEQSAKTASVVNALKLELTKNYSISALAPEFAAYVPGVTNFARESRVRHTYVKGEILRNFPLYVAGLATVAGGPLAGIAVGGFALGSSSEIAGPAPTEIDTKAIGPSGTDLHDMRLLVALLQSPSLLSASQTNPDFLQQLLKSPLYADNTQNRAARNFLNLMIQQEALGNKPLDKLAEDIGKFKGTLDPVVNGASGATDVLKSSLYQLAIALYYGEGEKRTGATNALFDNLIKSVTGGIQFAPNPARRADYRDSLYKVLEELASYMGVMRDYQNLKPDTQRYTLHTTGAMTVTAAADGKADLMLGGGEADTLAGSDGNDVLIGRGGADTLDGGAGYDTYIINSGEGTDTIIDSGTNRVIFNGKPFVGTFVKNAATGEYEFLDDKGVTVKFNSPGVLTLDADTQIVFQNQTSGEMLDGSFGLQLYEETAAAITSRTLTGDYQALDFDLSKPDIQTQKDDLGNIILDSTKPAPGRADSFNDSAGNDLILGLGGNDNIVSWRGGDDRIEGGDGDDWMIGGEGNDLVIGGAGRDVLVEGYGNDTLYAEGLVTVTDALAAENATPSGLPGEALSGGSGDDLAIGGIGNDVMFGGTGDDILIAGAGDDNIIGDAMADNIMPNWNVIRSVTTSDGATSYNATYDQFTMSWPTIGGADAIYAGAGADWVTAGYGNDYVDGGDSDDVIWGEAGNDDVFGGSGNDIISGDNINLPLSAHGDDYLDGEDGDDVLFGQGGNDQVFGGIGADQLYGSDGDDFLDGEDGDDVLLGGTGGDQLFGGTGNDQIAGDNGGYDTGGDADTIYGEAGNDILDGQGGDDVIDAGTDNDLVFGGLGDDQIAGGAGADQLQGEEGNDLLDGGDGNDTLFGQAGNDTLLGGAGTDQLQGGEGNDILDGGDDNDTLFGQAGNDTLLGGAGADYLLGGLGDDILNGGEGNDVYYYRMGEGNDRIADSGGIDLLVFNDILWGQLRLGTGSLKLSLPDGSEIHLDDFDPDNPYAAGGIEWFQFADNTVMSRNQLIDALGIQPTGTPEADVLSGTALSETIDALAGDDVVTARAGNDTIHAGDGADVVYAGEGNDTIYGGIGDDILLGEAGNDTLLGEAGNDLLAGGAGTDALQGGEGDDTYLFQSGDGQDTVTDSLGTNAIALGAGLALDAITFTRAGSDLLVAIKNSTDRLTVKDWYAADSHFASVTLGDGTLLDHAGVEAAMPRNQAPLLTADSATVTEDSATFVSGNALANDSDPEGRALRVTNPGSYAGAVGSFSLGSNGAYSYNLANNTAAVQSLAAGQSLTESFAYTATDDDPTGAATAASTIRITVQGANDLPVVGADSAATTEDAAPIGGNLLANDSDVDAGTTLTISNPGAKVGAYGTLNLAADGAWSYDLANASVAVQSLAAGQTVTENFAQTVSDGSAQVGGTLAIGITGRNDAPIIASALADQSVATNTSWSWTLPVGSFTDVDAGDVLGYGATLADGTALPSWLAFDAVTQTFSGRVPKSATGSIDIRAAATDRASASAADVFTLSFASGGGGGGGNGGGGSQGNEGVGNGVDAPPPGHDSSFNDGAGTGSGNPGAQGGNGYRPPIRADIVMTEAQIAVPIMEKQGPAATHGNSAEAHAAAPGQIQPAEGGTDALAAATGNGDDQAAVSPAPTFAAASDEASGLPAAADTGGSDQGKQTRWLTDAAWAYLDNRGADSSYTPSGKSGDSVAVFAQWLAVEQALARDSAGTMPDWLDQTKGADLRGLLATNGGFLGSNQILGTDTIGLLAGAGLKSFKGLAEGVQKIV